MERLRATLAAIPQSVNVSLVFPQEENPLVGNSLIVRVVFPWQLSVFFSLLLVIQLALVLYVSRLLRHYPFF